MKKTVLYQYMGTNGTILSPIHLEDVYYVRKMQLTAEANKMLTNGYRTVKTIIVPENEIDLWTEISNKGQM
jgi:hypothetical protein